MRIMQFPGISARSRRRSVKYQAPPINGDGSSVLPDGTALRPCSSEPYINGICGGGGSASGREQELSPSIHLRRVLSSRFISPWLDGSQSTQAAGNLFD